MNVLKTETRTCATHGEYTSTCFLRDQWTGCAACLESERQAHEQERKLQQRKERIAALTEALGTPPRYAGCTLEDTPAMHPRHRRVNAVLREYIGGPTYHNLVLAGGYGTGKTLAGFALAGAYIPQTGRGAAVVRARDIVQEIRATWRRNAEQTEEQVVDYYARVGLLVLDEIGVGFGSEVEQVQLLDVVDRRYQNELPIIAITNLSGPEEFKAAVGPRLYDRLRHGAKVLTFDWPSYREAAR